MKAIALAAVLFLLAVSVSCGTSGRASVARTDFARYRYEYVWQAASHLSSGCARRAESSVRWAVSPRTVFARGAADPLVYYTGGFLILSSRGDHFRHVGEYPTIWPCRTPVAIYQTRRGWMMTRLASKPAQRKTIPLGRLSRSTRWEIAPNGRFLFFHGQTIQYAGEKAFTPSGLPRGWKIESLEPSPHKPSVFVANVVSPRVCSYTTDQYYGPATAYLIESGASTKLRGNPCLDPDFLGRSDGTAQWTPDGRGMLWSVTSDDPEFGPYHLYLSDRRGGHMRKLVSKACGVLWSPKGKAIAYDDGDRFCSPHPRSVHVLDLSSGLTHFVADGKLEAWSPDGNELALLRRGHCGEVDSIAIVPTAGGPARTVITWPAQGC